MRHPHNEIKEVCRPTCGNVKTVTMETKPRLEEERHLGGERPRTQQHLLPSTATQPDRCLGERSKPDVLMTLRADLFHVFPTYCGSYKHVSHCNLLHQRAVYV